MHTFCKLKVLILCTVALLCATLAAQERRPVAVFEPFTKGPVTSLNKSTVRGAINSFLVNTGIYKVVDRARTEQILQEQGFQRSQLGDSSRAKSLGKLLGADLICISELIKEEGYFNAELSIIDVEIGEVTNAAYKLIAKDDPMAIDGAIREAMAELLGIKPQPRQEESAQKPVESKPKDAFAELVGVYTGSYTAGQGGTGLTLTIFMEGSECKAIFEFYSLPGRNNVPNGSYYMDVTKEATGNFYFKATKWIDHPSMYNTLNLRGKYNNGVLSGTIPTTSYEFKVTKQRR